MRGFVMVRKSGLAVCAITFLLASSTWVFAQDSKGENFEIPLGDIPHYADEQSAKKACSPDGVVWADRKNGFYYPKFFQDYGKTAYGTYTCHHDAVAADYWSLTPASDGGHKGRQFPEFFCYVCS